MSVEGVLNLLDRFVAEYVAYNRSVKWSFFHHHGAEGRSIAKELLTQWQRVKTSVLANPNPEYSHGLIMEQLRYLMKQDFLSGNYNPHSLKNYLLAYHDFFWDLRGEPLDETYHFKDEFKSYFRDTWEQAIPPAIKARYEEVSGIAEARRLQEFVEAALYSDSCISYKFAIL